MEHSMCHPAQRKKKQYHNTGDNTEKIWVHQFLTKPKRIAAGGMVVAGSREMLWWGAKPPFFFFLYETH